MLKYKILLLLPVSRRMHYKNIEDMITIIKGCTEYMAIMRNDLIQIANTVHKKDMQNLHPPIEKTENTNNHNRGMYE